MTDFLARRVATANPPMTREMTRLGNELARAGRSIMSLAQGEPDFDTPLHVREAAKAAIDAGATRYTDVPGTRELTAAIIRKFQRDNGLAFKPNEITIGVGSKQVLYNALQATVDAGDEVIVAVPAWVSYPEMVKLAEGVPVIVPAYADAGFKITPAQLEAAITPRTKAIMPVHLYGQCADMDAINAVAARHGLAVIEDAAQSFGATYHGRKSCNLSTFGCTSFFPSKPLGCYGDGGAIFTSDDTLATAMREIRVHGQSRRYVHTRVGVGGRMDIYVVNANGGTPQRVTDDQTHGAPRRVHEADNGEPRRDNREHHHRSRAHRAREVPARAGLAPGSGVR